MGAGAVQKTNVFQQPESGFATDRRRPWEMSYVDARELIAGIRKKEGTPTTERHRIENLAISGATSFVQNLVYTNTY